MQRIGCDPYMVATWVQCHWRPTNFVGVWPASRISSGFLAWTKTEELRSLVLSRGSCHFSNSSRFLPPSRISSRHFARTTTEEVAQFGNHAADRERSVYGCATGPVRLAANRRICMGCLSNPHRQRAVYLPARGPRGAMGIGGPLAGARGPGGPKLTQAQAIP